MKDGALWGTGWPPPPIGTFTKSCAVVIDDDDLDSDGDSLLLGFHTIDLTFRGSSEGGSCRSIC